ncbi:Na+/H+ antiporter family protein [Arcanobacterium pinnipediorum]|uniref:TRAP transporter large permease subunit n=1 Tax=Arcanobacterium pinnipediorum TaxID=1503041 RepID=A0ABY5AI48_9ACTO|nr:Na+/H+ antiporter NhaC family protein [Arcanobacterium pinnipediorum]USR79603.1 TRAP transporter large permease subunit [Arcanobacterium pinnipediorum]
MNAVLLAVILMLILALLRVHVVIALFIGALAGGLSAGLGLDGTMLAFELGLGDGAKIALSYGLLGAFAMAVAHAGLPEVLASQLIRRTTSTKTASRTALIKYSLLGGILLMAIFSQNLIPVHIAFIPILIPPLIPVFNQLHLDRRVVASILTFGLVTTYMFIPLGFGSVFLNDILLGNIAKAGLDVSGLNVMHAMAIPATGMLVGLVIAVGFSYSAPRNYPQTEAAAPNHAPPVSKKNLIVSVVAVLVTFGTQLLLNSLGYEADALLLGALLGLSVFLFTGTLKLRQADNAFSEGMKMMAIIGFTMISAQGFASVMNATGHIESLVSAANTLVAGNKALAALAMLIVGLIVTLGIGSSFSTLPIISTIYVPLAASLGFSPLATVAIIGTAGALGDAGSPASDSTLGPTSGLNVDGHHDHIRDSVIPTFLHFNLPLLAAGWIAAMVL